MNRLEEFVACIQKRLYRDFGMRYQAELAEGQLKIRGLGGELITSALIHYVDGLGVTFISCYWDGRHLWAVFHIDRP